jgi:hypothetical protein
VGQGGEIVAPTEAVRIKGTHAAISVFRNSGRRTTGLDNSEWVVSPAIRVPGSACRDLLHEFFLPGVYFPPGCRHSPRHTTADGFKQWSGVGHQFTGWRRDCCGTYREYLP